MRFKVLRGLALAAAISLSAIVSFMGWVGTGFSGPGNDVHSFLSQWLPVSSTMRSKMMAATARPRLSMSDDGGAFALAT